jgi:hypothetical protein
LTSLKLGKNVYEEMRLKIERINLKSAVKDYFPTSHRKQDGELCQQNDDCGSGFCNKGKSGHYRENQHDYIMKTILLILMRLRNLYTGRLISQTMMNQITQN